MSIAPATGTLLLDVAVILVAARIGGLLFERAGQPAVIGELVAGVLLGPTLLGALPGDPSGALFPPDSRAVLKSIGELGLVLFMFTVGWDLDLDLGLVRHRERAAAIVSVSSIALPFALGLVLAAYLHPEHDVVAGEAVPFWPFAVFVGASLSITAFPVLARILQETRLAATALGALVITAAAVDDVVGWSALALALALVASDGPWEYVRIVAATVAFAAALLFAVRPLLHRLPPVAAGALVLPAALTSAALTDAIGIHAVFGAFLFGAAMPRPAREGALREVRRHLAPVVGVLAPIYFVTSGMAVDIPGLRAGDAGAFVLILVAACAGKFLGSFGAARAIRVPPRDAAAIGVLMNTRGLVEIVLLTVGRDAGLIDDRLFTLLAVMAIVTTVVTVPALRIIGPRTAGEGRGTPEGGATGTETAPRGLHRAARRR